MPALKTRSVPAVSKALSILDQIADSAVGLTLTELIEWSGMAKSSVHYLVVTLERCGYVEKDEGTARYVLGQKLSRMARPS